VAVRRIGGVRLSSSQSETLTLPLLKGINREMVVLHTDEGPLGRRPGPLGRRPSDGPFGLVEGG